MTEVSSTSSIGAVWPPQPMTSERVRGFYPHVIETERGVDVFLGDVNNALKKTINHPSATRLSMRAVVDRVVVPCISEIGLRVEAALPVAGLLDKYVVYTAWNDPSRKMTDERLKQHHALITQAQNRSEAEQNPTAELAAKGYTPKIIDGSMTIEERAANRDRFAALYGTFGFDADEVTELLTKPSNTIAYIEDEHGTVISTVLAERATIALPSYYGKKKLTLIEITEAVTKPSAQGQGLYRSVSGFLIDRLTERRDAGTEEFDILYGESNLSSPGVIISAHRNGRRFSADDVNRLGLYGQQDFGILEQNVSVNDGRETRPYNDFAVTYVPLD